MKKTFKQFREDRKETLKTIGEPIYKEKQYVLLNSEDIILDAGNLKHFVNTARYGTYYDNCIFDIRRYDLYLNNNDKNNGAYMMLG